MAISNKFGLDGGHHRQQIRGVGWLCHAYGDMNGGFNPIKDLYKMQVFAPGRYRNSARPKGCLGPQASSFRRII